MTCDDLDLSMCHSTTSLIKPGPGHIDVSPGLRPPWCMPDVNLLPRLSCHFLVAEPGRSAGILGKVISDR